jgi:stage II sporulation protein GA (sporulation sigma-E factor processing peptidase)
VDNGILEMIFTYIVMSVLITLGAFGYINPESFIKNIICIFMVAFIFCGIINGIYSKNIITSNFSLLIFATLIAAMMIMITKYLSNNKLADENIVNVELFTGEETRVVRALIDTGNFLCEPITGKPVSLIRENVIDIECFKNGRLYVIPFKSVGKEKGVLTGCKIDRMTVYKKDKGIDINNPILAIYKGFFSERNEYDMILHPKIITEGENNV